MPSMVFWFPSLVLRSRLSMCHACAVPRCDACVSFSAAPLKKTSLSIMNSSTFLRASMAILSSTTSAMP